MKRYNLTSIALIVELVTNTGEHTISIQPIQMQLKLIAIKCFILFASFQCEYEMVAMKQSRKIMCIYPAISVYGRPQTMLIWCPFGLKKKR